MKYTSHKFIVRRRELSNKKIFSLVVRRLLTLNYRLPAAILFLLIFIAAMEYPAHKEQSYTYLALGDSYTIGEQVRGEENFPNQVHRMLMGKGFTFKTPAIVAKTGWTTDELQEGIHREKIHDQYDFVTLLIGVNNQYRGRKLSDYAREFESLLKQAIQFAGNNVSHVIVLSIPDWAATPFARGRNREQITREIDEYNKVNKEIAGRYKVGYIDITPGTRKALEDPSLLAPDSLHPSGKEYTKWAELVAGIIQKNL
jgi:lysophospholipase L1-like esterase